MFGSWNQRVPGIRNSAKSQIYEDKQDKIDRNTLDGTQSRPQRKTLSLQPQWRQEFKWPPKQIKWDFSPDIKSEQATQKIRQARFKGIAQLILAMLFHRHFRPDNTSQPLV